MPSARLLSVTLVLVSITTTAFLCSYLVVISDDLARSDLKLRLDESLSTCLEAGKTAVLRGSAEQLSAFSHGTIDAVFTFLNPKKITALTTLGELVANDWNTVASWPWHENRQYRMFYDFYYLEDQVSFGYILSNNLTVFIQRTTDGKEFYGIVNRGFQNKTYMTSLSNPSDPANNDTDLSQWKHPTQHPLFKHNSTTPLWEYPTVLNTGILAISFVCPVLHGGVQSGVVMLSIGLNVINEFIRSKFSPYFGRHSRMFITSRSNGSNGRLLAASHGNVSRGQELLFPWENGDDVIMLVGATLRNGTIQNDTVEVENDVFLVSTLVMQDEFGLNWFVSTALQKRFVMSGVDEISSRTIDSVRRSETEVETDLWNARYQALGVITAVTSFVLIITILCVFKAFQPLQKLRSDMACVAVMQFDNVGTYAKLSCLEEFRSMQISFLKMVEDLTEYRNFIPASALVDECDTYMETGQSSIISIVRPTLPQASVSRKNISLLICNVVGFLKLDSDNNTAASLSRYLTACLHHTKDNQGIPDTFSGDRYYGSFNGVRFCASHRTSVYRCASGLVSSTDSDVKLSVGLASGDARCGNMGCDSMMKYTFLGSLASWVHIVERVGRLRNGLISVDGPIFEANVNSAYFRYLQHVLFSKHSSAALIIREAVKDRRVKQEEWMYQLQELSPENDRYSEYNRSFEFFMSGNVEEAVRQLDVVKDDDSCDPVVVKFRETLRAAQANPDLCLPLGMLEPLLS